jgi:valyl-tRNA synthetase
MAEIELSVDATNPALRARLEESRALLLSLGRLRSLAFASAPVGAVRAATRELSFAVLLPRLEADAGRGQEEARKLREEIGRCEARLGDAVFLSKAPEKIVAGARSRLAELRTRLAALAAAEAGPGGA